MSFTVTASSFSTTSGADTLTKPTGVANGDQLLFGWCADDTGASITLAGSTLTALGWTQVGTAQQTSVVDGQRFEVWRKIASGEPANWAIGIGSSSQATGIMVRVAGQAATSPIDGSTVQQASTGQISGHTTNVVNAGVATTVDGDCLVFFGTVDFNAAGSMTFAAPSGYTPATSQSAGQWTGMQVAYLVQTTHGSAAAVTGTITNASASNGVYQSALIAVKSAAPTAEGILKEWSGSSWTSGKLPKAYNGSSFVQKPVKYWNGSAWVTCT